MVPSQRTFWPPVPSCTPALPENTAFPSTSPAQKVAPSVAPVTVRFFDRVESRMSVNSEFSLFTFPPTLLPLTCTSPWAMLRFPPIAES